MPLPAHRPRRSTNRCFAGQVGPVVACTHDDQCATPQAVVGTSSAAARPVAALDPRLPATLLPTERSFEDVRLFQLV
jgi:hypothetical protein